MALRFEFVGAVGDDAAAAAAAAVPDIDAWLEPNIDDATVAVACDDGCVTAAIFWLMRRKNVGDATFTLLLLPMPMPMRGGNSASGRCRFAATAASLLHTHRNLSHWAHSSLSSCAGVRVCVTVFRVCVMCTFGTKNTS